MDLGLKNKVALVCSSSQGLGYAVAESLAAEGVRLAICGRREDALKRAAAELADVYDADVLAVNCDLTKHSDREKLFKHVMERFERCDILVNNIGGPKTLLAKNATSEDWQSSFDQLFLSASHLTGLCLPSMQENNFGRITFITSMSVIEPIGNLALSTAMRAGLTGYMKSLSSEVADQNITVNCVMPGIIHTARIENLRIEKAKRSGTTLEVEMEQTRKQIPAGRLGKPKELGDLVTFLSSVNASYITGQNICVDGGLTKSW